MNRNLTLLSVLAALSSGCTMAPEHKRPEAPVPAAWPEGPAYGGGPAEAGAPSPSELPWREFITDGRLRAIIEKALVRNRDLRIAALNVERARAIYGIRRAELLPTVEATGSYTKQRIPPDSMGFGQALKYERYQVGLGITAWEIDFFGRIRSLKDQALEEFLATDEARRGLQILLVSAIATEYANLAADRENLKLARSTLEAQQESYRLIRRRFDVGDVNELVLRQAQSRVDAARVDMALYTRLIAQDRNALELMAGAGVPDDLLPEDLAAVGATKDISAGTSSEVLLNRPDILEAEHHLKAAEANIGAARAAFFPRISLTTAIGTASKNLSGLFEAGSEAWSFAPQIVMPIFDPRTWSALTATKVEREMAVAQYERAIQTAFREVADELATRGTVEDELSAQGSLVEAASETYRLANLRYQKGSENYLVVLDAQRSMYAAQQGLIALRLAKFANGVRLYAVLGGGADEPKAVDAAGAGGRPGEGRPGAAPPAGSTS